MSAALVFRLPLDLEFEISAQNTIEICPSVLAATLMQHKDSTNQFSWRIGVQINLEWNRRDVMKMATLRYTNPGMVGGRMTIRPVREEFIRRCILAGRVRPTEIQMKICDCALGLPAPFSVETVCELFVDYEHGITRATVFRAIQRIVDVGMLSEVDEQTGFLRLNRNNPSRE